MKNNLCYFIKRKYGQHKTKVYICLFVDYFQSLFNLLKLRHPTDTFEYWSMWCYYESK